MKWIKRGRQLGQAVKNVQRLRQILAVFAKYGFVNFVERLNLNKFLPGRLGAYADAQTDRALPERLRLVFEELGPTFVKFGQLLSTRSDILPEAFIEEFIQLQDHVQSLPFETVRQVIERELHRTIESAFSFFDPIPLASASIGQVHTAQLLTGENVVVKIQRPEIERIIDTDVSLLAFLAHLIEKYVPEMRVIGPSTIVDEFFRTLAFELDFVVEANNTVKMAENMRMFPEIVIPRVYKNFTTEKVLTLEKLEGIRANDFKAIEAAGVDKKKIVEIGARAFFKGVMVDGLFHGDLHGGNLFILPGNRLGIVDFGIVGRLSQKSRDQLASMVMSLATEDYENLCYEYAELGATASSIDFDGFQRAVRNTISPHMGLALADLNIGKILIEATQIATQFNIKVPGEWMTVFKAIITIEGMGRSLDPEFDLLSMTEELIKDFIKNQYSLHRLRKEFLWISKDVAILMKSLPRQIRWMFRKFNSNDFAFEIKSPDFQAIRHQLDTNGRRMSLSILISGLFISSSLALNSHSQQVIGDYPIAAILYFGAGCFFLADLLLKSFRK